MARGNGLSTGEAAKRLDVHPETLRRWEADGILTAERTSGGHRRYSAEELEALYTRIHALSPGQNQFPIKVELPEELHEQICLQHDNLILMAETLLARDYAPDDVKRVIESPESYIELLEEHIAESDNPSLAWRKIISNQSDLPLERQKLLLLLEWMCGKEYETEDVVEAIKDPNAHLTTFKAEINSW